MFCNVLVTKPFDHTFTYKLKSRVVNNYSDFAYCTLDKDQSVLKIKENFLINISMINLFSSRPRSKAGSSYLLDRRSSSL